MGGSIRRHAGMEEGKGTGLTGFASASQEVMMSSHS
jgi:hypothetical protein